MSQFLHSSKIVATSLGGGVSRKILAYSEAIMPVEVTFETGSIGAPHTHPHEQTTYVISGRFTFTCDGEEHTVEAGDSIYFSPNVTHGTVCQQAGRLLDVFTPHRADFL